MSEIQTITPAILASLALRGDLSGMNESQRVEYYAHRCAQAGLDPAAKPFDILVLNGKTVLYANATATHQLCAIHKLSVAITAREALQDVYTVCARVTGPDGRATENMGAANIGNLKGDALGNALMKATTKAIRRTVLAHCGLGMLDETEVETIPGAVRGNGVDLPATPKPPARQPETPRPAVSAPELTSRAADMLISIREASSKAVIDGLMESINDWSDAEFNPCAAAATARAAQLAKATPPAPAPVASPNLNPATWYLSADKKPLCSLHKDEMRYKPDGKYGPFWSCPRKTADGKWCKAIANAEEVTAAAG